MEYSKVVAIGSPVQCPGSDQLWSGPARVESPEPIPVDDGQHPLLEEVSPAYSASVIQRAFITWVHLGKKNKFRDVCDYYHSLEKVESGFEVEQRTKSRRKEYGLISRPPPQTEYFLKHWGHVYGHKATETTTDQDRLAGIWATHGVNQLAVTGVEATEAQRSYSKTF